MTGSPIPKSSPCGRNTYCSLCPSFDLCRLRTQKGTVRPENPVFHSACTSKPILPLPEQDGIGIAADIGTTSVCMNAYRLHDGRLLASASAYNAQSRFADDVIGRAGAAVNGQAEALKNAVTDCLSALENTVDPDHLPVSRRVFCGNTAMLYLLTGKDASCFCSAPFHAEDLFGKVADVNGKNVYLPSCVHAFAGADLVCGIADTLRCLPGETEMLIDIGTNGEIALWNGKDLFCASTAAGPCFEGAGLCCGMRAVSGAVSECFAVNGRVFAKTTDNSPARGICGSGMTDLVACLLDLEILEPSGRMDQDRFHIDENVYVTADDIRRFQVAKAAVQAGILTLMKEAGCEKADRVFLSGAFGTAARFSSLFRTGLLPAGMRGKTAAAGNTALNGASRMLTDMSFRERAAKLARNAVYIPLAEHPSFARLFTCCMSFPEI